MTMDVVEYEVQINAELCRCCLAGSDHLNELFRCVTVGRKVLSVSNIYRDVTNLSLSDDDGLPQSVCATCETDLFEAFMFRRKCRNSLDAIRGISNATDGKAILSADSSDAELEVIVEHLEEMDEHGSKDFIEIDEMESVSTASIPDEIHEEDHENILERVELLDNVDQDDSPDGVEQAELDDDESKEPTGNASFTPANATSMPLEDRLIDETCEQCKERFSSLLVYNGHVERHTTLQPLIIAANEFYRCAQCYAIFIDIECFQLHFQNEDACCEPSHASNDSLGDYPTAEDHMNIRLLSAHIEVDGDRRCVCSLCPQTFCDVDAFRKHFNSTHSDMDADYLQAGRSHACGVCGIAEGNLHETLEHVYFHQADFECLQRQCTERFKGFSSLYEHVIAAHAMEMLAEYKVCVYCLHVVRNLTELQEHKRSQCHKRNFECRNCDKKFFRRSTLFMHERSHTNKTFPCKLCGKTFLQNHDVKNHMRVHTKERPYKCRQCDKTFKTVSQRNGHEATHVTANIYTCSICKKAMKSERILREHMKTHAGRRFSCDLCQRKFSRRYHLTTHMKNYHNEEMSFQ